MKKIFSFLLAAMLLVSGCAGDSNDNGNDNDPALVGTWNLTSLTFNEVELDISGFSQTLTITTSSYTTTFSDGCTEAGTYTTLGDTITITVTSVTGCSEDYGKVVGNQLSSTYTVNGTTLTRAGTDNSGATYIQVWTKA